MIGKVTIKEVAKRANVSISTVSRVVNGLDKVKPSTYKKVIKAINDLEFVPNQVAVSMVKKETKTIVMLVPDIINPFYTAFVHGAEEVARKNGYLTFVCSTEDSEEVEKQYIQDLLSINVDGFLFVPCQRNGEAYESIPKPIVLVDRYYNNCQLNGVVIDNFTGAYLGVKHLIEKGHTRISIINGPIDFNIGSERYWGYERAMLDAGLEINLQYIKTGSWYEESGYKAAGELLELSNPPTAIFATNNLICSGAIKAILDLGRSLGDEISLVGFDDHDLAGFVKPAVTVISRPTIEMGRNAAERLFHIIRSKEDVTIQKNVLSTKLTIRDSVKQLR